MSAPLDAPVDPRAPVGVVVVGEGETADSGVEMHKLLRLPRYFDTDLDGTAVRCYRCGGTGHMSKDCKNEARQKPCILCAQFGHVRNECPQALCFKCKRPGHISRECPGGGSMNTGKPCLRCGISSCRCSGRSDYIRAAGGCVSKYRSSDLALVRCYVCYSHGHLTCKQTPRALPQASCYNCGEPNHAGPECWREVPPAIRGEQAEIAREEKSATGWYQGQEEGRMWEVQDSYGRHNWRDQQFQRAMSSYQEGRSVWNRMSYVDNRRSGVGDGRWDAAGRYFDGEYYNDDRNTQSHKRSHRMVYYDADEDRNRWGGKHTRFY